MNYKFKENSKVDLLKRKLKKSLIIIFDNLSSYLVSNLSPIRYFYLLRQIRINNPRGVKNKKYNLGIIYEERIKYLVDQFQINNDVGVIIIPRTLLSIGFKFFLRKYNKDRQYLPYGEYDLDNFRSEIYKKNRNKYIKYARWINRILKAKYNCTNILIPKCNDDWSIDYISSCNLESIKVFIDDREGASTPKRNQIMPARLKGFDFKFELMTTQNSIHKQLFVDSGFDESKIIINGAVQTDYWKKKDTWLDLYKCNIGLDKQKIKILFFAFGPRTYVYFYYGNEARTWAPLSKDIHNVISEILNIYKDKIQIIYKFSGKIKRDSSEDLSSFCESNKRFIDNNSLLLLGSNISSMDLIRHCQIIIGFQTTGMIEAMNTSKQIIYTAWGEFYEEIENTLLPLSNEKCLDVCSSKEMFFETLQNAIIRESNKIKYSNFCPEERKKLIEKYFTYSDGNVSKRLVELISEKIINN
tara:strand:+ start:158 stop:1567 length:1410 start_codon:yes stop_codon:yes gene_type:complete